jgi:flagellar basal body-associated protein FliL
VTAIEELAIVKKEVLLIILLVVLLVLVVVDMAVVVPINTNKGKQSIKLFPFIYYSATLSKA